MVQSHSFPAASFVCPFLSYEMPASRLTCCTVQPSHGYPGWKQETASQGSATGTPVLALLHQTDLDKKQSDLGDPC